MERLTKKSFSYTTIIFILYQLFDYFSKLFQLEVGEDSFNIHYTSCIENNYRNKGITSIHIELPIIDKSLITYSNTEVKEILNDYLRIVLLPNQRLLPTYCNNTNSSIYDIVEPLFIDMIDVNNDRMTVNIIFIDNPVAYQYVRHLESKEKTI